MKPLHLALIAGGAVVVFFAIHQTQKPAPAPLPPTVNPTGGYSAGGTGGGQSDFAAGANAFGAFFSAVGNVAQVVAKQS